MANILQLMPYLEGEELMYIQGLLQDFDDAKVQQFASVYGSRRKDPTTILILTILGLLGIAGVQRFILGQIGMGILYFLTGGLCLIGTIIDLVNHKKLTFEFNSKEAQQVVNLVRQFAQK